MGTGLGKPSLGTVQVEVAWASACDSLSSQGFQGKTGPPGPPGVVGPQVRDGVPRCNWSPCVTCTHTGEGHGLGESSPGPCRCWSC